jgi:hypothetical protein
VSNNSGQDEAFAGVNKAACHKTALSNLQPGSLEVFRTLLRWRNSFKF